MHAMQVMRPSNCDETSLVFVMLSWHGRCESLPRSSYKHRITKAKGCDSLVWGMLWRCWLGGRKGIRPVKNWVVGCWRGYLGWAADLHIAQQMPLPLTVSCSSKSRLVLTFLVLPFWYLLCSPGWSRTNSRRAVKRLCVCVYWSESFTARKLLLVAASTFGLPTD